MLSNINMCNFFAVVPKPSGVNLLCWRMVRSRSVFDIIFKLYAYPCSNNVKNSKYKTVIYVRSVAM